MLHYSTPRLYSAFDGYGASLQHQLMSLNMFCVLFLNSIHDAYMAIFCPASWLPLYHLPSTWLQLAPVSYIAIPRSTPNDYAYCYKLDCALTPISKSSQASTQCVVSGFLLVKVCAIVGCSPPGSVCL